MTPRYAPQRSFPPYRYRPGLDPHPTRDARGHSHRREPESIAPFAESTAFDHDQFRFGADLYNHAFFWEAHEAFEELWRRAAARSRERALLQGLIQAAAAQLKKAVGDERGARRLVGLSREKLARVAPRSCAIDVTSFAERLAADVAGSGPFARIVLAR